MDHAPAPLKIKIQIHCGDDIAMGPGKADLLDAIRDEGSISAAARRMGMSYRRAWLLVDAMNRCFARPLVATSPGRAAQGSARLTPDGVTVLSHYRNLQVMALSLNESAAWGELAAMIRPAPLPRQGADG